MIEVREWKRGDMGCLERYGEIATDLMTGITLLEDGCVLACGGVMDQVWGKELWIEAPKILNSKQRHQIAKIAKKFVEAELILGEDLHAHVYSDDVQAPRWLRFLGFEHLERFENYEGRLLDHYRLEVSGGS